MTLQSDKLKHLAVGLFLSLGTYGVTGHLGWTWAVVITGAALKEAHDATGRGRVEARDFIATILPAGVPTLLAQSGLTFALFG